jgi:hypothetical protein
MNHRINPDAHAHVRIACERFHETVLHTNCFTAAKLCIDESHINFRKTKKTSSIFFCLLSVTLGPNEFLIIYWKVKSPRTNRNGQVPADCDADGTEFLLRHRLKLRSTWQRNYFIIKRSMNPAQALNKFTSTRFYTSARITVSWIPGKTREL